MFFYVKDLWRMVSLVNTGVELIPMQLRLQVDILSFISLNVKLWASLDSALVRLLIRMCYKGIQYEVKKEF